MISRKKKKDGGSLEHSAQGWESKYCGLGILLYMNY